VRSWKQEGNSRADSLDGNEREVDFRIHASSITVLRVDTEADRLRVVSAAIPALLFDAITLYTNLIAPPKTGPATRKVIHHPR